MAEEAWVSEPVAVTLGCMPVPPNPTMYCPEEPFAKEGLLFADMIALRFWAVSGRLDLCLFAVVASFCYTKL